MKRFLIALAMTSILSSCPGTDPKEITATEFESLYTQKRTKWARIDYVGERDGFYYLVRFGVGKNGSYVKEQEVYRTRVTPEVGRIVANPQPPIEPTSPPKWTDRIGKGQ
jgi:hypothetical protein